MIFHEAGVHAPWWRASCRRCGTPEPTWPVLADDQSPSRVTDNAVHLSASHFTVVVVPSLQVAR